MAEHAYNTDMNSSRLMSSDADSSEQCAEIGPLDYIRTVDNRQSIYSQIQFALESDSIALRLSALGNLRSLDLLIVAQHFDTIAEIATSDESPEVRAKAIEAIGPFLGEPGSTRQRKALRTLASSLNSSDYSVLNSAWSQLSHYLELDIKWLGGEPTAPPTHEAILAKETKNELRQLTAELVVTSPELFSLPAHLTPRVTLAITADTTLPARTRTLALASAVNQVPNEAWPMYEKLLTTAPEGKEYESWAKGETLPEFQNSAMRLLKRLDCAGVDVTPILTRLKERLLADDGGDDTCALAIDAISRREKWAKKMIPELKYAAMREGAPRTQAEALTVLSKVMGNGKELESLLLSGLSNQSSWVRVHAVLASDQLEDLADNEALKDALMKSLQDEDKNVAKFAGSTIGSHFGRELLPELKALRKEAKLDHTREYASRAIDGINFHHPRGLNWFGEQMYRAVKAVKQGVLTLMGREPKSMLEKLEDLLTERGYDVDEVLDR